MHRVARNHYSIPASAIRKGRTAIGDGDPDDMPYLAAAIAVENAILWSDDIIFSEQNHVDWYTTEEVIELYTTGELKSEQSS